MQADIISGNVKKTAIFFLESAVTEYTHQMFIDEATIDIKAGDGGAGAVSFRREKYMPLGGPDGGDGGYGGKVTFVSKYSESTLNTFRYNKKFHAENGKSGSGNSRHGRNGEDIEIPVPCGTQIYNLETGELLRDLVKDGQEFLAAKGGMGGKGNEFFKSSTQQSPKFAQPGIPGEALKLKLVLKLLADVALIGMPNAGKSTLISRITSAKPEIADYPFTTLNPKIGVAEVDGDSFVVADMPGLIEGASTGKGLGTRFLKHIERSAVLCHLIDVSDLNPERIQHDFEVIENELLKYSEELPQKRELVVLTKIDTISDKELLGKIEKEFSDNDIEVMSISAVTGENLDPLLRRIARSVKETREARQAEDMERERELLERDDDY